MKPTIKFEQAFPQPGKELLVTQPEVFRTAMSRAFNFAPVPGQQWELVLTKDQLERLEGMAAMHFDSTVNPFDSLCRAIHRYGSVRVWIEYGETATAAKEEGRE